jgi:hypothetical protein
MFAQSAEIVNFIAANISDEKLRTMFMDSAAVKEVVTEAGRVSQ